ncbi:MAG TPA: carboxymuconolactone decarboxylase family protein [Solirubrobacteraceae bacterium]|jgi:AhpD family alkylhydroperoxidase
MTVVEGVPARRNPLIRLTYALARWELKRLTGKALMTPDIPIRAHRYGQLVGYAKFEKSVARRPLVPERLRALAVLKSAVMQGCEMCQDIGSFEARANGASEEQLRDLPCYRDSEHFDETERRVLDLAVAMTRTPVVVPPELLEQLRAELGDAGVVELVHLIAVENLRSRFNGAFGLSATGFSEGMACARLEPEVGAGLGPAPSSAAASGQTPPGAGGQDGTGDGTGLAIAS